MLAYPPPPASGMACRAPEFRAGRRRRRQPTVTRPRMGKIKRTDGSVTERPARIRSAPQHRAFRDPAPPELHVRSTRSHDTCFRIPFRASQKCPAGGRRERPPFHDAPVVSRSRFARVAEAVRCFRSAGSRRLLVLTAARPLVAPPSPWGLRRASGVPTGATHRTWSHPSQSRPGRYGAARGADATLCGGASTSSPPARARRARVTVRPTYRGRGAGGPCGLVVRWCTGLVQFCGTSRAGRRVLAVVAGIASCRWERSHRR